MSQSTSDKNTADFMSELRAQTAAQDATLDAQLASILVRKPSKKMRKIEPAPEWLVKRAPKKTTPPAANKFDRKKFGKSKP
jgi:hypothetical protein